MIYETARHLSPAPHTDASPVEGIDANGNTETTTLGTPAPFRQPDDGIAGFLSRGVIADYVAPPITLPDLAPYQFRAMLALSGKQGELDAFIEALPEPNKTVARAKLEYSLVFKRDNDLVQAAQSGMGLTTEGMDALWLQASSIL